MAKLSKQLSKSATEQAAEWGDRGPLDAGTYLVQLLAVDTTKSGPKSF